MQHTSISASSIKNVLHNHNHANMGSHTIAHWTEIPSRGVEMRDMQIRNQLAKLFMFIISNMNMGLYYAFMS